VLRSAFDPVKNGGFGVRIRAAVLTTVMTVAAGALASTGVASAKPVFMPTVTKEIKLQKAAYKHELAVYQRQKAAYARQRAAGHASGGAINPTAPPCPENGVLYPNPTPVPFPIYPLGNCGIGQPPATTVPWLGNMAYYGGHVEVHPHVYLVYWGWGESDAAHKTTAFPGQTCTPETFSEGSISATLKCDPDGAGKYMADFVAQMGGTDWANVSTQYYQTDSKGNQTYISNDKNVLGGIWVDDSNDITGMPNSKSGNAAGPTNTYTLLAQEASRAAQYFGVTGAALNDANFVIVQPPGYTDPNALGSGYCAFHDYTEFGTPGNFYYDPSKGVQQHIAYTNMPYLLAINFPYIVDNQGGNIFMGNNQNENVCGENAVNAGKAGKLDGFSIALGHEIEETITDPGAESNVGQGASVTMAGGWYGATDPSENGDKCAWVGEPATAALSVQLPSQAPQEIPVFGAMGDIKGNAGSTFAVQSLWSNAANAGTGYCAGAGTDSPIPAAAYGVNSPRSGGSGGGSGSGSGSGSGASSGSGSGASSGSGAGAGSGSGSNTWAPGTTKATSNSRHLTRHKTAIRTKRQRRHKSRHHKRSLHKATKRR
jgi:hypothetical protein